MQTNIQVFENVDFGKVRIVEVNGEPYFVGKDVAEILGYSNINKAIQMHVDEEDKKVLDFKGFSRFGNTLWGENDFSNKTVINESGLYSLILSSKLQKAKEFKHWVTAEVIPQIRKTGRYVAPNVPNMDKLSLTTQCLINLEIANNQLRKDLDGTVQKLDVAVKRIEELEHSVKANPGKPEPQAKTKPKPWSERETDYLRKAYALGQTDTEIAADMGRTEDSVYNKRRALGLRDDSKCKRHWRPAEDKKLKKYYNQGISAYDIGQLLGRSLDSVEGRLHRLRKAGRL